MLRRVACSVPVWPLPRQVNKYPIQRSFTAIGTGGQSFKSAMASGQQQHKPPCASCCLAALLACSLFGCLGRGTLRPPGRHHTRGCARLRCACILVAQECCAPTLHLHVLATATCQQPPTPSSLNAQRLLLNRCATRTRLARGFGARAVVWASQPTAAHLPPPPAFLLRTWHGAHGRARGLLQVAAVESVVGPVHCECISERHSSQKSYLSVTIGPVWVENGNQVRRTAAGDVGRPVCNATPAAATGGG